MFRRGYAYSRLVAALFLPLLGACAFSQQTDVSTTAAELAASPTLDVAEPTQTQTPPGSTQTPAAAEKSPAAAEKSPAAAAEEAPAAAEEAPAAAEEAPAAAEEAPAAAAEEAPASSAPTTTPTAAAAATVASPTRAPEAVSGADVPAFERTLSVQEPPLSGEDVEAVSRRLAELEYILAEDVKRMYDDSLAYDVRVFQDGNGLEVDGIVGPRTWQRLFSRIVDPQQPLYPILLTKRGSSFVLGGWHGGRWLDAIITAKHLQGGESYRLYSAEQPLGSAVGSDPSGPKQDVCGWVRALELDPPPPQERTIAISGDWNALPRVAEELSVESDVYQQAVAEVLIQQGMEQPEVRLTRVVRVDLEGDGVDEVLISATHVKHMPEMYRAAVGDYSLVMLRKVVAGSVETTLLAADLQLEPNEHEIPFVYTLGGFFDLNGDKRMEILVDERYYEGQGTSVYGLMHGDVQKLRPLGMFCGV